MEKCGKHDATRHRHLGPSPDPHPTPTPTLDGVPAIGPSHLAYRHSPVCGAELPHQRRLTTPPRRRLSGALASFRPASSDLCACGSWRRQVASTSYWGWVQMLFLGAFLVDIAVEHVDLHKRIALKACLPASSPGGGLGPLAWNGRCPKFERERGMSCDARGWFTAPRHDTQQFKQKPKSPHTCDGAKVYEGRSVIGSTWRKTAGDGA